MFDIDGSADPFEIPRFIEALTRGADLAKGSRFTAGGSASNQRPRTCSSGRLTASTTSSSIAVIDSLGAQIVT